MKTSKKIGVITKLEFSPSAIETVANTNSLYCTAIFPCLARSLLHFRSLMTGGARLLLAAAILAGVGHSQAGTVTFNTPGNFSFTVPTNVTQIKVDVSGGAGGNGSKLYPESYLR